MTVSPVQWLARRVGRALQARPRVGLVMLLVGPVAWLLVVYVGSLALLVVSAFFGLNEFTGKATG